MTTFRQTGWAANRDQYAVPVLFNPYTGEPRDVRDVQSDPQGILIVPPGKVEILVAQPEQEPVAWTEGPNEWKDWCGRWFGSDADDDYLAKAVFDLPPMAQKFHYTAINQQADSEQEPVGEVLNERGEVDYISYVPPVGTRLYTTPPAAQPAQATAYDEGYKAGWADAQPKQECWCHKCNENRLVNNIPFSMTRMIVCPTCGNKRCPKASDHRLDCTDSNESGQPGSVYTNPPAAQRKPLTDEQWFQSELFKLAVSKGLLTIHTELVAPSTDQKTKVSWMEGHDRACDISNEAAHGIKEGA